MRVLMISYVMPHRMTTGAEVCTQNYIDAIINGGHELDLVAYTRAGDRSVPPPNFYSAGAWHIETDLAGPVAYLWLGRAYLTGSAYVTTKFRSRKFVDLIAGTQDCFGNKKSSGQFFIVTRRPHRRGDGFIANPNLERLFHRQLILPRFDGAADRGQHRHLGN